MILYDSKYIGHLQFAHYLEKVFKACGWLSTKITIVHVDVESPATLNNFRLVLQKFNQQKSIWLIVNFLPKVLFSIDEEYGHFAPIAAYDEEEETVLLMDPYREMLEPYWVPLPQLFRAMHTKNSESATYRGYIRVDAGYQ